MWNRIGIGNLNCFAEVFNGFVDITLFAMYAGYRSYGVFGLRLGPVILMILRCLFAPQIEKGLFKDLFEEK